MCKLVSVIIPTTPDRSRFLELAIKCYESQTYPHKELIVVEGDGSIGHKLNQGCSKANGECLVRFDSDDWSSPNRLTDQMNRLNLSGKSVTGYSAIYFWDERDNTASYYRGPKDYCLGASLCFKHSYWETNHFQDTNKGEDLYFQKRAKDSKDIIAVPAEQMMVARLHGSNTMSSRMQWVPVSKDKLNQQFFRRIND